MADATKKADTEETKPDKKDGEVKLVGELKDVPAKALQDALAAQFPKLSDTFKVVTVKGKVVLVHGEKSGLRKVTL
jgi:hypothetical protein